MRIRASHFASDIISLRSLYHHTIAMIDLMLDDLRGKACVLAVLWFKISVQIVHLDLLVPCTRVFPI